MQYISIKDAIQEQISQGVLSPLQKLPPERKLAETFGTTRVTLREALALLESDGVIYREDRRGWFIAAPRLAFSPQDFVSVSESAHDQQRDFSATFFIDKHQLATQDTARQLSLPPFSDVHHIEAVCCLEHRPVVNLTYSISGAITDTFAFQDNADDSLPLVYGAALGETAAIRSLLSYRVTVCSLNGDIASRLHATSGTSGLLIERIFGDANGQAQMIERMHWRHDAVLLTHHA